MVKRYDCKGAVVTHEAGPFVLYEDYELLKQNAMDSIVQLQKRLDSLARAYAELGSKVATK